MLSEERAERPGGVRGEGGAVVGGAAGGDEEEVVRRHQQRLQQEVGGGTHEGVHEEPATRRGVVTGKVAFRALNVK